MSPKASSLFIERLMHCMKRKVVHKVYAVRSWWNINFSLNIISTYLLDEAGYGKIFALVKKVFDCLPFGTTSGSKISRHQTLLRFGCPDIADGSNFDVVNNFVTLGNTSKNKGQQVLLWT